ncbi:DUF3108 domain-containing protein [Hydrogenimonas sp. SS33]|uniref:DUF3108 domain-containing protein n=1 Tax=Hydrogenimonas leucolamina TaxID=2954236 RepID=UPI00336BB2B6
MRRLLPLLLLFTLFLHAETVRGKYVVEYGIFGKMGEATATLVVKDGRYRVEMKAWATGLAKVLSGGRVEIYTSEGRVENGRLVPERYTKDIRHSGKRRVKNYVFNHAEKRVTYIQVRYKDGKKRDTDSGTLPYYAKNDIFSLYFNILKIIGDCGTPFDRTLHAVGAEKKTGRVRVETLTGKEKKEAKELLGDAPCYLRVTVYQKLFGSKGGKLYLAMRKDNIVTKAVLKDVVMFGDVRGRLVDLKREE